MEKCQVCRMPIIDVARKVTREIEEKNEDRQFVIIENGTGHYPYINEDRYDVYYPCNVEWLAPRPDNFLELLINDYDNCIVSVDSFLGELINALRYKNAVVLYVSDHGQYLGESGKYLHGDNENELLRHVASFIWFSDEYERRHPELVAEMKSVKDKLLVHGQIYATILRLCGIKSEVPLDIGDFVNGDVREVEHNLPKSMNIPSRVVEK
jgi:glucan phosphoethanolaminetransferase (alkaline phosphatase superfamily)